MNGAIAAQLRSADGTFTAGAAEPAEPVRRRPGYWRRLHTPEAVRSALAAVARGVAQGRIAPERGRALADILNTLLRSFGTEAR